MGASSEAKTMETRMVPMRKRVGEGAQRVQDVE